MNYLKFLPWGIVVVLVIGLSLAFNGMNQANAKAKLWEQKHSRLSEINRSNLLILNRHKEAERQNAVIAASLAARLNEIGQRDEQIERAIKNDPAYRDWAAQPLPDSLRQALAAR